MTPKAAEYAAMALRMTARLAGEGADVSFFAEQQAFKITCMSADRREPTAAEWSLLDEQAAELRAKTIRHEVLEEARAQGRAAE